MPDDRIQWGGVNHLALVCRDMARTVEFYDGVLGMPLVKTVELPEAMGQHFFFDCGGGDMLAFFWFPEAPDPVPGITGPAARPDSGDLTSAVASMNHVAFHVPADRIEQYRDRLIAQGIECSEVWNHDDSEYGLAPEMGPDVWVRSVYFFDPDGILLELASTTREPRPEDVRHEPARAVPRSEAAAPTTTSG
jgi:catechol 2,3-dioxygenase-like lactoylglutathione lyase family enzyme